MSDTPIKFKYGELNNLNTIEPSVNTEGTVYVAKATDNRAYLYADLGGVRYDIATPKAYYGKSSDESQTVKTASVDGFVREPGATVTILFTTPLSLNNATLNINSGGNVAIIYRGNAASKKSLPANSVYTFIYIDNQYHLIGDLDQVNNGIAVTTNEAEFIGYAPILVSKNAITEDTKSTIAATNPNLQIMANNTTGCIRAPGGFYNNGQDSDTGYGMDFYVNSDVMRWSGMSDYSGDEGYWQIYNNGSTLELAEDWNYGGVIAKIDYNGNFETQGNHSSWSGDFYAESGNFYSQGYRLPRVYYGTSAPASSLGEDGDVYIMYS